MADLIYTFDYPNFILIYPVYSDATKYPQATLQEYWNTAIDFMSNSVSACLLTGLSRLRALNLFTAHLAYLATGLATGRIPKVISATGIDKINVTLQAPPLKNQFDWWLNTSPFGMQLSALLKIKVAGGFYVGSSLAMPAFRKADGGF